MDLRSRKTSLVILAVTALVLSRILFALFNDPEGPNLLIVVVAAAVVYLISLGAYLWYKSGGGAKRFLLAFFVQMVVVAGLYVGLK